MIDMGVWYDSKDRVNEKGSKIPNLYKNGKGVSPFNLIPFGLYPDPQPNDETFEVTVWNEFESVVNHTHINDVYRNEWCDTFSADLADQWVSSGDVLGEFCDHFLLCICHGLSPLGFIVC